MVPALGQELVQLRVLAVASHAITCLSACSTAKDE